MSYSWRPTLDLYYAWDLKSICERKERQERKTYMLWNISWSETSNFYLPSLSWCRSKNWLRVSLFNYSYSGNFKQLSHVGRKKMLRLRIHVVPIVILIDDRWHYWVQWRSASSRLWTYLRHLQLANRALGWIWKKMWWFSDIQENVQNLRFSRRRIHNNKEDTCLCYDQPVWCSTRNGI